ncbi:hypothetical protein PDESU_05994 [Pontiella desulfatans]|uniref:DUF2293 domain-containing protein n=1 Tax=Pontiella desulfatans TaxID=2750659 RepID=A0A6C2UB76_PONDE|nr:DUF2293 domain-containing protein [Pontiella desulfatans]VGO17398.1 hypothetical protein PDESU_05994 [Pontiella desulfatans]
MAGKTPPDDDQPKVFISAQAATCDQCGKELDRHAWMVPQENKKALCLSCAGLDLLVFLPSGDAALTRRSKKHSRLSAAVLQWNSQRKRFERQGLLVENEALEQAKLECSADAPLRKQRQAQASVRRAELDQEYIKAFAAKVRQLYPDCPPGRENQIAEHACRKYSGRVGRSAMAKELDEKAVRLAVAAHIRHTETPYDHLLETTRSRALARAKVLDKVNFTLRIWS